MASHPERSNSLNNQETYKVRAALQLMSANVVRWMIRTFTSEQNEWHKFSYTVEISPEDEQRFAAINDHLQSGSAIFIAKHTSYADALIVAPALQRLPNLQKAVVPAAMKYIDTTYEAPAKDGESAQAQGKRTKKYRRMARVFAPIKRAVENRSAAQFMPVPQSRDYAANAQAEQLLAAFYAELEDAMSGPGGVFALTPEGKRIPGEAVGTFKPGVGRALLDYPDALFVTFGFHFDDDARKMRITVNEATAGRELLTAAGLDAELAQWGKKSLAEKSNKDELVVQATELARQELITFQSQTATPTQS